MPKEKNIVSESTAQIAVAEPEEMPPQPAMTDEKKLKIYRIVSAALLLVIVFLVVARWIWSGWWIDWNKNTKRPGDTTNGQTQGEFVKPDFEANAVSGVPTVSEDLGWSVLTIKEGFEVHVCGVLRADKKGVLPLYFSSNADNNVWVKLRILDADGNRLGETGLLLPGEYVESVKLNEKAKSGEVKLQVMGYEPKTYYSAGTVALQTILKMD